MISTESSDVLSMWEGRELGMEDEVYVYGLSSQVIVLLKITEVCVQLEKRGHVLNILEREKMFIPI